VQPLWSSMMVIVADIRQIRKSQKKQWHLEAKTAPAILPTNDRMTRQFMQCNTPYIPQQYRRQLQKNIVSKNCYVIRAVLHSNLKRILFSDMYEYMHILVSTATGYGQDSPVSIPGRGKIFLFSTSFRPTLRPAPIDIGDDFSEYKAARAWSWPLTFIQCRS
jgi:hypothetical protein